jgi:uncharacterized membrane protein
MASRLSPEAQARLAAARAIAQGKTPPASTKAKPVPAATQEAGSRAAVPTKPEDAAAPAAGQAETGRKLPLVLALLGIVLLGAVAGGAWMTLGRRPDLLGDTTAIQKGLRGGEVRGAEGKKAVAEVIRNADQMTKQELEDARKALDEEWKTTRDAAIDAYFAAPEGDRSRLADEGIDRTITYRKLRFGLSPQAREEKGRKQKPPENGDRRQLFERYAQALQSQAKKRGIALPEWP